MNSSSLKGSILSFVKPQPSESLLKSKDGLKQEKLDCFMKPKKEFAQELSKYSPSKKRQDCDKLESTPAKRAKVVTTNSEVNTDLITCDINNVTAKIEKPKTIRSLSSKKNYTCNSRKNCDIENSKKLLFNSFDANERDRSKSPVLKSTKRQLLHQEKNEVEKKVLKQDSKRKVEYQVLSANGEEKTMYCNKENNQTGNLTDSCDLKAKATVTDTLQSVSSNIEFKEFDDLDFSFDEDDMQELTKPKSNNLLKCRYKVLEVENVFNEQGYEVKRLMVKNKGTQIKSNLDLQDDCADLNIEVGDVVNIIVDENSPSSKVSSMQNLIVHHPDTLISGTTVSNALGCVRRAILSERFKNTELAGVDDVTNIMLIGTLAHSVFQKALVSDKPITPTILSNIAKSTMTEPRYLKDLVALRTTKKIILDEMAKYIPQIQAWLGKYNRKKVTRGVGQLDINTPSPSINGKPCHKTNRYKASVAMTEVQDIEENVWSARYGLKGKIDITGKFMIKNNKTNELFETVLPVEIKTGRESNSMEHHIQVAIYSLFCGERRNLIGQPGSLATGLLLYLKSNKMFSVPMKRTDKHGMIMLRNKIADYLVKTVKLRVGDKFNEFYEANSFPGTIKNTRICQRCSQLRNCALVHRSVDNKDSSKQPSTDLSSLFKEQVGHLSDDDLAYFRHWMTCTFVEAKEVGKKEKMKKFWLKTPKQRCERGSCINELKLAGKPMRTTTSNLLQQTFKRAFYQIPSTPSKKKEVFEVGEMVLISGQEPEFIAMATAVIEKITTDFITVSTDRDFSKYDEMMSYSIDRHVWISQVSVQSSLANLSMLLDNDVHCNRLRNLLIAHSDPTFGQNLDFIPRSSKDEVAKMLRGLNRTQRQAIKRVLLSNDYTLVVGMPGSGKTTTIVAMIQILLLCGLRVLVTSYTHSAVDNLLMKLIKYKVKFLRLGRKSQIHPNVQPYSEEHLSESFTEAKQLHALYNQARVVGCTCLAVTSHTFFAIPGQGRTIFDVCIVDEASQITQPACLSPLMQAKRFVLVGDHQQLPPLVVSPEARQMGADESLFWRLTRHKPAVCDLTLQYRMNSDIMGVSNHMTYEGRLECAKPSVAIATVTLDRFDQVKNTLFDQENTEWLVRCLEPKVSVLFLDTSEKSYHEQEVDNGLVNNSEAQILSEITQNLVKAGACCKDIGIISPFRKQLSIIEERINSVLPPDQKNLVEINTVDKYQGRDKSVILLSFVRSRPDKLAEKKGELLNDWRRLNVAVTRAKHKLVMVGCTRSLMEYQPCEKLINYLWSKNMTHKL